MSYETRRAKQILADIEAWGTNKLNEWGRDITMRLSLVASERETEARALSILAGVLATNLAETNLTIEDIGEMMAGAVAKVRADNETKRRKLRSR